MKLRTRYLFYRNKYFFCLSKNFSGIAMRFSFFSISESFSNEGMKPISTEPNSTLSSTIGKSMHTFNRILFDTSTLQLDLINVKEDLSSSNLSLCTTVAEFGSFCSTIRIKEILQL